MATALLVLVSEEKESMDAHPLPPHPACDAALKQEQACDAALKQEQAAPALEGSQAVTVLCLLDMTERKVRLSEGMARLELAEHTLAVSKRDKALDAIVRGLDIIGSLWGRTDMDEETKMQFYACVKCLVLPPLSSKPSPADEKE
jgi:hypothetical protein